MLNCMTIMMRRWNVLAGAARPNPQGSFKYRHINVIDVYVLKNKPPVVINGKRRTTLSGISYSAPKTPLRLADQFNLTGIYELDFPTRPLIGSPRIGTSIINGTYKGFMEVIFQNNDTTIQSYHMDGYAFFVVGMDYGEWTENYRGTYNKWDGVARCTTQEKSGVPLVAHEKFSEPRVVELNLLPYDCNNDRLPTMPY